MLGGSLQSWKKQENHPQDCEEGTVCRGTEIRYYWSHAGPPNSYGEGESFQGPCGL